MSKNHGWTKETWLIYKDWSKRWICWAMNWYRISVAVADAESRED